MQGPSYLMAVKIFALWGVIRFLDLDSHNSYTSLRYEVQ